MIYNLFIDAFHSCNIGSIVKVLAAHDGKGELAFFNRGSVWLMESPHPMTWSIDKKLLHRKRGPIPDKFLKPIRGKPMDQEAPIVELVHAPSSPSEQLATLE